MDEAKPDTLGAAEAPQRVVLVDDDLLLLTITRRVLTRAGYEVQGCDEPRQALLDILERPPFAVIADLVMPDLDGRELLYLVQGLSPAVRRVLYTGEEAEGGAVAAPSARHEAPEVTVKKTEGARLVEVLSSLAHGTARFDSSLAHAPISRPPEPGSEDPNAALDLARALARALATGRPGDTFGDALYLTRLACALGRGLGLGGADLRALELGALVHDVGMARLPAALRFGKGPLDQAGWAEVKRHTELGAHALRHAHALKEALPVVLHHHERFDGNGYPQRLAGSDIPLGARIFAVADAYDAMTRPRPFAPTKCAADARAELRAQAGKQLDPAILAVFETLSDALVAGRAGTESGAGEA